MDGKLYFGGMSTDIELKKLMDAYGEAEPGTLITHNQIADLIGAQYGTSRYGTVVSRWRRTMLAKNNIEVAARRREGYVVSTASERVQNASNAFKRIGDGLRRIHYRFAAVPRQDLSSEDARRADHSQMVVAKMCDDVASARKQISPPPAQTRSPQGVLVVR